MLGVVAVVPVEELVASLGAPEVAPLVMPFDGLEAAGAVSVGALEAVDAIGVPPAIEPPPIERPWCEPPT